MLVFKIQTERSESDSWVVVPLRKIHDMKMDKLREMFGLALLSYHCKAMLCLKENGLFQWR